MQNLISKFINNATSGSPIMLLVHIYWWPDRRLGSFATSVTCPCFSVLQTPSCQSVRSLSSSTSTKSRRRGLTRSFSSSKIITSNSSKQRHLQSSATKTTVVTVPRNATPTRFAWLKRLRPKMGTRGVSDRLTHSGTWPLTLNHNHFNSDDHRDSSEALQLFMRLLTNAEREEVHRLLSFLYMVRGLLILFLLTSLPLN